MVIFVQRARDTSEDYQPVAIRLWRLRLRADATRRMRPRDNALYLVCKIVERLSRQWRALNDGANLMALVAEGYIFKHGMLQPEKIPELAGARS